MEDKLYSILGFGLILFSTYRYFWKISLLKIESSMDYSIKINGIGSSIGLYVLGIWLSSFISLNVTGYALIIDALLAAVYGYLNKEISSNLKTHRMSLLIFSILSFIMGLAMLLV